MLIPVINKSCINPLPSNKTKTADNNNKISIKHKFSKQTQISNMATQTRVREKIVLLSNVCYGDPSLEVCDIYWSYLHNIDMVLDKQEKMINRKRKMINRDEHARRWDVI